MKEPSGLPTVGTARRGPAVAGRAASPGAGADGPGPRSDSGPPALRGRAGPRPCTWATSQHRSKIGFDTPTNKPPKYYYQSLFTAQAAAIALHIWATDPKLGRFAGLGSKIASFRTNQASGRTVKLRIWRFGTNDMGVTLCADFDELFGRLERDKIC